MRGEEKYLRENYKTMTAKEIAGQLDRTKRNNIRAALGLRKQGMENIGRYKVAKATSGQSWNNIYTNGKKSSRGAEYTRVT